MPYAQVGPTPLPDFYMPYTARVNRQPRALAPALHRLGARDGDARVAAGPPGAGIWDEHKVAAYDFAECAARLHPDATGPELDISSAWLTWGTYGDDFFPQVFGTDARPGGGEGLQRPAVAVHAA